MSNKILKTIVALLLIMTLTMANFVMVGANLVTYAVDTLSGTTVTNNKNVTFDVYFKEGEEKTSTIQKSVNDENIKLYMKVSVKNEGYFNGVISLENSNFKIKQEKLSEKINKIEENVITLNHINAGEEVELEFGVEPIKADNIDLGLLNMMSNISVSGKYKDSTEKNIDIKATRQVQLKLVGPYEEEATLNSEIITNKIYNIDGENKRIVQLLVQSGLLEDGYPIKETKIEASVPENIENVTVISRGTKATNGKEGTDFNESNWNYSEQENKIDVTIENKEEAGKINWLKGHKDEILITYVMDGTAEVSEQELKVKSEITLYDENKTIKTAEEVVKIADEKDGIITTSIETEESSIYKGKIYSGENREYNLTAKIHVNNTQIKRETEATLKVATYDGSIEANSQYIKTIINKEQVLKILGETGYLNIETIDGEVISHITKDTQASENGTIEVEYPEGIKQIKVKTSEPVQNGTIELNITKSIKEEQYSRETIQNIHTLNEAIEDSQAQIELKETKTEATISLDRESLSTVVENTGVEMRVTLNTNSEENDLYSNPNIKIQLPHQVENATVNSINLLYENDLKIVSANIYDENGIKTIELQLEGEQQEHQDKTVEGTTIIINANLTIDKKSASSDEAVKLICTNPRTGITLNEEQKIEIVSPRGIVTVNTIDEYGISAIGEEETKTAKLQLEAEAKQVAVNIETINNNEETINDVRILGKMPTKSENNNIDTTVGEIEVNGAETEIYYSENENVNTDINDETNNWSTTIEDSSKVKTYLIVAKSLEPAQGLTATYNVNIPEGLEYNNIAQEGYSVTYSNETTNVEDTINATNIVLSTGRGPELKTTLQATKSGIELKDGDKVANGEVIKYIATVENTGTENATNVTIKGKVPEGTVVVTRAEDVYAERYYTENPEQKEAIFTESNIEVGKKVVKEYEVKVTNNTAVDTEITNKISTLYGEAVSESNEVKQNVKKGELQVTVNRRTDLKTELRRGVVVEYKVIVENLTQETLKNVKVKLNIPQELKLERVEEYTVNSDEDTDKVYDTDTLEIGDMTQGMAKGFIVRAKVESGSVKEGEELTKTVVITATAVADGTEEYTSNGYEDKIQAYRLEINLTSSTANTSVKTGDTIEYIIAVANNTDVASNAVRIKDSIPKELTVQSVEVNGEPVELGEDDVNNVFVMKEIEAHSTCEIKVKAIVNYAGRTEAKVITNVATLSDYMETITTPEVTHILQLDEKISANGESTNKVPSMMISGTAWIDENLNGKRDSNEKLPQGVSVMLLDTATGDIAKNTDGTTITGTTNDRGLYVLNKVPQGKYMVVFDYDKDIYTVTAYQKEGVQESVNSDAVVQTLSINGKQDTYGATDIITMENQDVSNVNIGLINSTKFDLELNKYVSKIVVQKGSNSETHNFGNSTLAKVEIAGKNLNNSNVLIEYTIEVKNTGEVAGYVKNIVDYIPSDLKFSSELNSDWYQSNSKIYNKSLANTKIGAGETKTVKLTLTKSMTEENTGLVNNTAEIAETYNDIGAKDVDSTPNNQAQGEDDMGLADVIIGVKTGAMVSYISLIIGIMALIIVGAYYTHKKFAKETNVKIDL